MIGFCEEGTGCREVEGEEEGVVAPRCGDDDTGQLQGLPDQEVSGASCAPRTGGCQGQVEGAQGTLQQLLISSPPVP